MVLKPDVLFDVHRLCSTVMLLDLSIPKPPAPLFSKTFPLIVEFSELATPRADAAEE